MKLLGIILLTLSFIPNSILASKSYRSSRPSRTSVRRVSKPSSRSNAQPAAPIEAVAYKKSLASLKSYFFDFNGKSLTINNVRSDGDFFIVQGSYTKKSDMNRLVSYIKGNEQVDKELKISEEKDSWPGSSYYNYKIRAKNIWK